MAGDNPVPAPQRQQGGEDRDTTLITAFAMVAIAIGFFSLLFAAVSGISRVATFIVVGFAFLGLAIAICLARIAWLLGVRGN